MAPPRDVFLTAGARAYQKHVLHGPETVSIFIYKPAEAQKDDFRPFVAPTCARVEDRGGSISPLPISIVDIAFADVDKI